VSRSSLPKYLEQHAHDIVCALLAAQQCVNRACRTKQPHTKDGNQGIELNEPNYWPADHPGATDWKAQLVAAGCTQ
jgi:hypothetical protein